MPVYKPTADLEFLDRVDEALRRGDTQRSIAADEELPGASAGSLAYKLALTGFRPERFNGGPRLVSTLDGRDYAAMRAAGEIVAAAEEPVAA